jgi:hypothetical protein
LGFSGADETVADALALGAVFVAVITGGITKRTIFPVGAVGGAGVDAIAAFAGDGLAAPTAGDSSVVARTAALGAMRHGEFSFQHVDMIRPRSGGSYTGLHGFRIFCGEGADLKFGHYICLGT